MRGAAAVAASAILVGASARADFVATGRFLYVDRAFTFDGGFTGAEPQLPMRFADVRVVRVSGTTTTLAQTVTDDAGFFSVVVPGSGTADLQVRCLSSSPSSGATPVRVTTLGGVVYSVASPTVAGWDLGTDLDFGTILSPKAIAGGKQGNPFHLLDLGVRTLETVQSPLVGGVPPSQTVQMIWPAGVGGSFATGVSVFVEDDDGYDDLAVLHELGHVVQVNGARTAAILDQLKVLLGEGP